MSDSVTPPPSPSGNRPPAKRLERAPGTRYAGGRGATPGGPGSGAGGPAGANPAQAIALAVLVALLGGIILFIIGSLDLGAGLIALSAAVGWVTGIAIADGRRGRGGYPAGPARIAIAAVLAGLAAAGALFALGIYAILEGGVLSPIDYLAARFGVLALLDVAAASVAAAIRAR